jgi:hypothetical protein
MLSNFNLPSVDHLVEGVHYRIVDWDFAQSAPAAPAGQGCPEGEKMVFGACRKVGGGTGEKDWDTSKDTEQEKKIGEEAKKQKSTFDSNKPVTMNGKKYGWAKKNGKAVLVEWGSVAGEKKVGPKKPQGGSGGSGGRSGQGGQRSGASNATAATIEGWKKALEKHRASGNEAAAAATEELIRQAGG